MILGKWVFEIVLFQRLACANNASLALNDVIWVALVESTTKALEAACATVLTLLWIPFLIPFQPENVFQRPTEAPSTHHKASSPRSLCCRGAEYSPRFVRSPRLSYVRLYRYRITPVTTSRMYGQQVGGIRWFSTAIPNLHH